MANGTVSVIIPCYNSEKFVRFALDSVLSQDRKPNEILCVDDNSSDSTGLVLKEYQDSVVVIRHAGVRNRGCAASLNLAASHSKSDYLAFLDHDDVWMPNKLTKQAELLDSFPEVGMVYCNGYAMSDDNGRMYRLLHEGHKECCDPQLLLLDCYIKSCSSVMVRRSVFNEFGPFDERFIAMDHDLWLKIMEKCEVRYDPSCLYEHRIHLNQNSRRRKLWEDGFLILEDALRRHPYGNAIRMKRLAVLHYRLGMFDAIQRHFLKAGFRMMLASLLDPSRTVSEIWKFAKSKSIRS